MRLDPILAHNLLLQGELVRLARELNGRGIEFIALKGVTLLQRTYGRLDARSVSDNDLLFRASDLPRALRALGELGYEAKVQASLEDALLFDARYVMGTRQHGRDLWLDIHTSAFVPTIHQADEEWFWGHTDTFDVGGTPIRVFSPEVTLLHLIAHAEQHRFCEPRILNDVAAAWNTWTEDPSQRAHARRNSPQGRSSEQKLDTTLVLGLAAKVGLQHAVDYVLGVAQELGLLRTPTPYVGSARAARLRRLLPPERLLRAAERNSLESYYRSACALVLRDPDRVAAQLRKDFLPPLSKLAVIHDRPASPILYLHYATRPFRPLARALGWRPPPPAH
jgi:hypothetical protein